MQTGKIAKLTDKHYGFITQDGESKNVFFHSNELVDVRFDDLNEGDSVTFNVTEGPKGLNATNVKRVS
tara:strand:- start:1661 stop:1864 length:204 start_codon:yes stop_codon:yes gene_type:complete